MLLIAGILLAVFVLDGPWAVAAVAVGATAELAESLLWIRWSQRRRAKVGAETLIGRTAKVVAPGLVQVKGELWRARSTAAEPLAEGATVRILALEDLTLLVEPLPEDG
jgi:membrane protein implicated in regulation of membrane protease activity